jgi:hypothetical protein
MRTFGTAHLMPPPPIEGPKRWLIDAEPHVRMMLRRVFAGVPKSGQIYLDATASNCRDLEWFLLRYPLEVSEPAFLHAQAALHRDTMRRIEDVMGGKGNGKVFDLALPLRDYQKQATEVYLARGSLLLADDLGLGKTAVAIGSFCEPSALPAVVVTLTHLTFQWEHEIRKFAPGLRSHIIKNGEPYELPTVDGRGPDILILNYHKLAGWSDYLEGWAASVIFDECQEIRRQGQPMTAKYEAAEAVAARCAYRLGLSATPIYNYGDEMWNILNVLAPGSLGSYWEFAREWCTHVSTTGARVREPAALGSFLREEFLMLRRTRAEVGRELPPVLRIPHTIESDARELLKVKESAAELARIIVKRAAATQEERYVAGGQFDMLMRQATGIAKAPYVADFVQVLLQSEQRIVLAGWHREVYGMWEERLGASGIRYVYYTGTESPLQKQKAFDAFTKGDAQVLFLSLRSGAGLEGLQEACNVIVFGELDWSPGVHEQCIGRLHRDGLTGPVTAYYLIAEDGADPVMADVLGVKREQAAGIRDPDAPLIERLDRGGGHVAEMARRFLAQGG